MGGVSVILRSRTLDSNRFCSRGGKQSRGCGALKTEWFSKLRGREQKLCLCVGPSPATIMQVNFKYDKSKGVWCLLNKGKSSNNSSKPTDQYRLIAEKYGDK